jgi:hypothetical protein
MDEPRVAPFNDEQLPGEPLWANVESFIAVASYCGKISKLRRAIWLLTRFAGSALHLLTGSDDQPD